MIGKLLGAATMAAGLAVAPPEAAASLIGDQVSVSVSDSFLTPSSTTATVVAGPVEFYLGFTSSYPHTMPINVEANTISFLSGGGFQFREGVSVTVSDLDFADAPGGITGISVTGTDPWRFTYTAHSLTFIFGGLWTNEINATVTLDTTAIPTIPEPASLSVFGAGLLGLLGLRRRQRGMARPGGGLPDPT